MQDCSVIIVKCFCVLLLGLTVIVALVGTITFIRDTVNEHKQSRCPKCGKIHFCEIFCPDCGTRILPDVRCPKCNCMCTGRYCGNCGTELKR